MMHWKANVESKSIYRCEGDPGGFWEKGGSESSPSRLS